MTSAALPEVVRPVLEALRTYMHSLYPELRASPLPLEFWRIENDDLFIEALGYLPLHMGVTDSGEVPNLAQMPEGFRLAFPIYWLEDDYLFNGWHALTNGTRTAGCSSHSAVAIGNSNIRTSPVVSRFPGSRATI